MESHLLKPVALQKCDRGLPATQYLMLAPSQRAAWVESHPPRGSGGDTHAPTGVPPGVGAHTRPAAAQSTRTSWPLKQPTDVFPSQRFAEAVHAGPGVAQSAVPSAAVTHRRPKAAQSKLASLPFSQ